MLLYDEIEKQVKEERRKKQAETMKEKFEKGEIKSLGIGKGYEVTTSKKDDWTSTAKQVAQKVRVKPNMIKKAKKIKEVAEFPKPEHSKDFHNNLLKK